MVGTPAEACGPNVTEVKSVVTAGCQDAIHTTHTTCAMQCGARTNPSNFNLQPYNCLPAFLAEASGTYPGVLVLTVKLCMLARIDFFKRNCGLDLKRCHRTTALLPAPVPGQQSGII